ncbi:MAG TPA: arginine--tRNA ligase [Gemmatimonadaceae bacterium]|jgi:arginyl-tRNA synthetase|nr:arginine--tRNA ligase [Gemmatimonadaceae bacterium]
MSADQRLRAELVRAARTLGAPDDVEPVLERPRDPAFGDWATNLAMTLARPLGRKPRDLAQQVIDAMDLARGGVQSAEIAGPGFINFRVRTDLVGEGLLALVAAGDDYGHSDSAAGQVVNVEFVSANPTGPLHVGHGRQAALGDAISSLLEATGWRVTREFYYNDAGAQIMNLALSVQARIAQLRGRDVALPEGGYHGDYIREIAQRYIDSAPGDPDGADLDAVRRFAVQELRKEQDLDLQAFGVKFAVYFLESSLYAEGRVERTIRQLVAAGHTYEQDGALWLRTTDFGDDKDRVMRRSAEKGGEPTYFVPDVAYHVSKWERGFRRAINVQGADHHSTVTRVRGGLQALHLGIPEGYPEYVLHQMVTVLKGGEEVKISKRAGSYVTVRDLIDEVGRDAVRYFFLMRKGDSQLQFDVDLARSQSEENPVYYIQMAHARMCGIFRVGEIDPATVTGEGVDMAQLARPEEGELIKALLDYPALVAGAAGALEPHRVATYLHDLAGRVHLWYHTSHVLDEPAPLMRARLLLARASQVVLRNGLTLLGINAPERM